MKKRMSALLALAIIAAASAVQAQNLASTSSRQSPEDYLAKMQDFPEFKHRVFMVIDTFDRSRTRSADIEAIMERPFVSEPGEASFLAGASSSKRVAHGFRHLAFEEHIVLTPEAHKGAPGQAAPETIGYGFEGVELSSLDTTIRNREIVEDMDLCLSLHELQSRFKTQTGWHFVQASMVYPGLVTTRDGAKLSAFIWPDSMKTTMSPAEEEEFRKLSAGGASQRNPQSVKRLAELKAKIDGCVFMLEIR